MPEEVQYFGDSKHFPQTNEIYCSNQILVEEILEIPVFKPDINRLIDMKINALVDSFSFINSPGGKLVYIRGRLEQKILYAAKDCDPIYDLFFISNFRNYIKLPASPIINYAALESHSPKILIEYGEIQKISCRKIFRSLILFLWYPTDLICCTKAPSKNNIPCCKFEQKKQHKARPINCHTP